MPEKTKNPDYTNSAVNANDVPGTPCNPLEVIQAYGRRTDKLNEIAAVNTIIDNLIPKDVLARREKALAELTTIENELRVAIGSFGSYQDVDAGQYAVRQRKVSVSYSAREVRKLFPPTVADFVIVETVDPKSLAAAVDAGKVSEALVKTCATEKVTYAFIIK